MTCITMHPSGVHNFTNEPCYEEEPTVIQQWIDLRNGRLDLGTENRGPYQTLLATCLDSQLARLTKCRVGKLDNQIILDPLIEDDTSERRVLALVGEIVNNRTGKRWPRVEVKWEQLVDDVSMLAQSRNDGGRYDEIYTLAIFPNRQLLDMYMRLCQQQYYRDGKDLIFPEQTYNT